MRSIFITGAASGIGRETAHRFAGAGWRLGLCDRDAAALASVEAEVGVAASSHVADVRDAGALAAALTEFCGEDALGVLFNCAGILEMRDPMLDRAHRSLFPAIGDHMGRIVGDGEGARLFRLPIAVLQQGAGQLVKAGALADGCTLGLLGARCHQHGGARSEGKSDGGPIGPVGDRGQTHDDDDFRMRRLAPS